MSVTKDGDTGRWMSQIRVTDWTGKTIHKKKRGFATKKEALQWERDFISQSTGSLGMTFGDFISLYVKDMEHRLKPSTVASKKWLTENSRMGADAAIAVVSASSLAAGVIVTSLTTGMTTDVDSYMFGSILAMDRSDVALSAGLSAAVLLLFVLFYHKLFAITFDESFSRATGVRVGLYNTFLSVLTALTIVLGMRMMGAMLISSLVIFPALSAMRVRKSFRGVVILAGILSVTCFCAGLTASYLLSTPVGATVVIADLLAFLVCSIVGKK